MSSYNAAFRATQTSMALDCAMMSRERLIYDEFGGLLRLSFAQLSTTTVDHNPVAFDCWPLTLSVTSLALVFGRHVRCSCPENV